MYNPQKSNPIGKGGAASATALSASSAVTTGIPPCCPPGEDKAPITGNSPPGITGDPLISTMASVADVSTTALDAEMYANPVVTATSHSPTSQAPTLPSAPLVMVTSTGSLSSTSFTPPLSPTWVMATPQKPSPCNDVGRPSSPPLLPPRCGELMSDGFNGDLDAYIESCVDSYA